MTSSVKRILVVPGCTREAIEYTVSYIDKVLEKKSCARIYVVGSRDVVKNIGVRIGRELLREKKVVLYRVVTSKDYGEETLRLFIEINPSILVYILYPRITRGYNGELFSRLRYSRDITVISYTRGDYYLDIGYSVGDLESLVEKTIDLIEEGSDNV